MAHQHLDDPAQQQGARKVAEALNKLDDQIQRTDAFLTLLTGASAVLDIDVAELEAASLQLNLGRGLILKFGLDMLHAAGDLPKQQYAEAVAEAMVAIMDLQNQLNDLIGKQRTSAGV